MACCRCRGHVRCGNGVVTGMATRSDMIWSLRRVAGPVLGACLVGYFAFHAMHGERGVRAWLKLRQDVAATQAMAAAVAEQRRRWEHRVRLLHPDSLDPDLLDERVREMLNYTDPGDIVILLPDPPPDSPARPGRAE